MPRETGERSPDRSYEPLLQSIFDRWAHGDLTAGSELLAEHIRYSAAQPEGQVRADGRAARADSSATSLQAGSATGSSCTSSSSARRWRSSPAVPNTGSGRAA